VEPREKARESLDRFLHVIFSHGRAGARASGRTASAHALRALDIPLFPKTKAIGTVIPAHEVSFIARFMRR